MLTFGDRVRQLVRTFQAKGKSVSDLADSLGVSESTVRRWAESRVPAPRSEDPSEGRGVAMRLESRYGGLDYRHFRRVERYHHHEAPLDPDRAVGPEPPDIPDPQFPDEARGVLPRPVFLLGADAASSLLEQDTLRQAVEEGRRVTFNLRYIPFGMEGDPDAWTDRSFTVDFAGGVPAHVQIDDFLSGAWHETRRVFRAAGDDSNFAVSVVSAHAG